MEHRNLAQLIELTKLQVTASQTKLRKLLMRRDKLDAILNDLTEQHPNALLSVANSEASIVIFQNEMRLQRWLDQRRASVNSELAQTHALIAMAQASLGHQIARHQALQKVANHLKKSDLQKMKRKDYYCS